MPLGHPPYANQSSVPDFDSHYVLCITVWELNSGKFHSSPNVVCWSGRVSRLPYACLKEYS